MQFESTECDASMDTITTHLGRMGMADEKMRFSCRPDAKMIAKNAIDTAMLNVDIGETGSVSVELWAQSVECYKCSLMKICTLPRRISHLLVNVTYATDIALKSENGTFLCASQRYHFGEQGVYNLSYDGGDCRLVEAVSPINSYLPILYSASFFLLLAVIYSILLLLHRKYERTHNGTPADIVAVSFISDLGSPTPAESSSSVNRQSATIDDDQTPIVDEQQKMIHQRTTRYRFLDVFRGISIVVMVFVNYGGGKYWFFGHSIWNGLTVADLVFPWFMFIMGTSMALSFESLARKAVPKLKILRKTIRRSVVLFVLGLFVVNQPKVWSEMRVMGVLQRFAISYLAVGLLRLVTAKPASILRHSYDNRQAILRWVHLLDFWPEWLLAVICLTLWTLFTFLLPVPGCPSGYLGIGGLESAGAFVNCSGGAAGYIDRLLLGSDHLWAYAGKDIYQVNMKTDPEGLLGCFSAVLCVLLGMLAGQILLLNQNHRSRIGRFALFAVIFGIAAAALCGVSKNEGLIPINKRLWTPSFVFALSALAFLLIILLYLLTDVWQIWRGEPFYFAGLNSIAIYLGHEVFYKQLPLFWQIKPETHANRLYMNLWGTTFWVLIAYWMHRSKFYITV